MTMTRGILNCKHLHIFLGGGIECYSYPKDRRANPIEPLKIYELDFILTGLLVMITTPKNKYLLTNQYFRRWDRDILQGTTIMVNMGSTKYLLLAKKIVFVAQKHVVRSPESIRGDRGEPARG